MFHMGYRCATSFLLLAACFAGPEMPTENDLVDQFPERRATLDTLRLLSDEDARIPRIRFDVAPVDSAPASRTVDAAREISRQRWDRYAALFRRVDASGGLERAADGKVFIIVRSWGMLNSGVSRGYAYLPVDAQRARIVGSIEGDRRTEPIFRHLTDRWYVFEKHRN